MKKKFVNGKFFLLAMKMIFVGKTILKIFFLFFEGKIVREKKKIFWSVFISDRNYISVANNVINDEFFFSLSIIYFWIKFFREKNFLVKKFFDENY